tara:strand:+ start:587 stop:1432 length:846 start_codon:yes stop_codon:yes gene_type:complete
MKAVIPAAGLGTRFLPLTKAQPKEMLPVVNKPTIQWVVEEAVEAGITDIAIITGNHKKSIEDHFSEQTDLETSLKNTKKFEELEKIRKINSLANLTFIVQGEQKGLGHAISCAEEFVANSPFVVLLGDTICQGNPNCTKGLVQMFNDKGKSIVAVKNISRSDTNRYGIVSGVKLEEGIMFVDELVEKPEPEDAPSLLGLLGRYVFTPDLFHHLKNIKPGADGELQLTDGMQGLAKESGMFSWNFKGERYDIGTMKDWFQSHLELSSKSQFSPILDEVISKL